MLFDDTFQVWRAARLPVETLQEKARFVGHVRGHSVIARDDLLDSGEDWTARLREAAS